MKKRIIALFFSILLVVTLFAGCSSTPNAEIVENDIVQETTGSYYLFKTQKAQEYLTFLENFDETKYEIVDISTSLYGTRTYGSDEFYIITYKIISESE